MISGQFLNITPFFLAILRPLFRGHSIAHESSYVPLIETRRQKKPLEASTRNGEVKARARYVRVVERQHLVPSFPPSSHRIIPLFPSYPFYPCPVSFRLFSISPPLSLSLSLLPSTLRPRSSFSTALVPVLTPVQAAAVVPTLLP